ncbi:Uncharacterised protein [uncultured archaeon]|nr:Uncharacterised protein [uncultured archaeon]
MSSTISDISASPSFVPSSFFFMKSTLLGLFVGLTITSLPLLRPSSLLISLNIPTSFSPTIESVTSTTTFMLFRFFGFFSSILSTGRIFNSRLSFLLRIAIGLPAVRSSIFACILWQ